MRLFVGTAEERLAGRLRNGDSDALQELYTRYAGYMAAVIARYIPDDDAVKDVLQDSFIRILRNLDRFEYRGPGSLQAWMRRIAVNQALKHLRQKKREEWIRLDWDVADEAECPDPPLRDIPPALIHRLVRELPTAYRTVFNLYVFEGRSHKEIAATLGIKADSSASNLHRAKNLLARRLHQYKNKKQMP